MSLDADVLVRNGTFEVEARLSIDAGSTVALLGPNGSGKSTLVSCLAGLLSPERGTVSLDGDVLDDAVADLHVSPELRPVGVVFQGLLLFPHLSAVENVAFPLRARGVGRHEARAKALDLLERLGVGHRAAARPAQLSGGEAQRIALARAIVHEPRLLLLDEPLSALDVQARSEIRSVLGRTLDEFPGVRVLVTHDPVEAMTMADRMVLLEAGRVTQEGTPEEIRTGPRSAYAADLVGVNLFAGRLVPLEEGAGLLETPQGGVVVAWPASATGPTGGVLGLLRPSDVSLFRSRPEGSARNVLEGPITSLTHEGERVRVRLGSSPPVVAEITLGSMDRMGLTEGVSVWASFKAVEVEVVLP
jgi:molybdate transport system ATP-binding protein